MPPLKFGFCVPVFANPGAAFFRTPAWTALEPTEAVAAGVESERLGYDSIWVADHLIHGVDGGIMEGWTTLSVIAGQTRRVQLGSIHLAQPFRHPALLAKMAATLDSLSGGRLILFYDCGWNESEVRAYGLPWHETQERIDRMDEGLTLIDQLWQAGTKNPLSFQGRFFSTQDAICLPAPVRTQERPRPPVWLGEARDDTWLDLTAKHAEGWNSVPASPTRLAERIARVRAACERAGRDPSALELSLEIQILIGESEREVRSLVRQIASLPPSPRGRPREDIVQWAGSSDPRPLGALTDDWLAGTPDQVAEQVRAYADLGVTHFMLWFLDFPSRGGMKLFAEQVAPALR